MIPSLFNTYHVILPLILSHVTITTANRTQICQKQNVHVENAEKTVTADNTFSQFVKSHPVWADKSLLVKALAEEKEKNILLVNAPRGWCKTLNLKMLQTYYEIVTDTDGKRIPLNRTFAYNYFRRGVIYLKHGNQKRIHPAPLISRYADIIEDSLGQFPVIYINFMAVPMEKKLSLFRIQLSDVFKSHSYIFNGIINNRNISDDLKTRAIKYKKIILNADKTSEDDLLAGIRTLCELLYTYHGKKVIVLIDEYDYTIQCNYFDPFNKLTNRSDSYVTDTYAKFAYYTFHTNEYLEKAIITTVLPVNAALGIQRANNVVEYGLIDGNDIFVYFGFTTVEVFDLMKFHGIEDDKRDEMVKWYGGYNCPNSPSGHIFSPSVLRFANTKKFTSYVVKSIFFQFLFNLRKFSEFETVVTFVQQTGYRTEYSAIKVNLNERDCRFINSLVMKNSVKKFEKQHCDMALGLLSSMGFITIDNTFKSDTEVRLVAPNEESRSEIMNGIETRFEKFKK